MSLVDDFRMYYRQTYIGYRTNSGRVLPFYVQEISSSGSGIDNLNFIGQVMYDDRNTDRTVNHGSGKLILELPELGYVVYRGRPLWLSYRPVHQASKGLQGRRVVGSQMNNDLARAIYRAVNDQPNDLARQFLLADNGKMYYKKREIGTHSGDTATVKEAVSYLGAYLTKAYPNISRVEVES